MLCLLWSIDQEALRNDLFIIIETIQTVIGKKQLKMETNKTEGLIVTGKNPREETKIEMEEETESEPQKLINYFGFIQEKNLATG